MSISKHLALMFAFAAASLFHAGCAEPDSGTEADEAIQQVYEGKLGSLRRFKDDVSEVKTGFECGIGFESYNDLKVGDVIEVFTVERVAATIS